MSACLHKKNLAMMHILVIENNLALLLEPKSINCQKHKIVGPFLNKTNVLLQYILILTFFACQV